MNFAFAPSRNECGKHFDQRYIMVQRSAMFEYPDP